MVDVLLATWNGSRFLAELLDSLLAQSCKSYRLLVSDDGSTDDTLAIIERYRVNFGERLVVLPARSSGGGGLRNFEYLMQASLDSRQARWVMFCDQDDVWLPHKIEQSLREMRCTESRTGRDQPCLVHTDLIVVNEELQEVAPSFVRYQSMDPVRCSALWLLSMNQVTGCATMINRELLRMALPIPPEVVVHDWWCAVLSGSGQRTFIDVPTILYRQHAVNQIGASKRSLSRRIVRLLQNAPGEIRRARLAGSNSYRQAQALAERLRLLQRDASTVDRYLAWRRLPLLQRIRSYRTYYPGGDIDRLMRCVLWPPGLQSAGLQENLVVTQTTE